MTKNELETLLESTRQEIYRTKDRLADTTDPQEERRLLAVLKELQIKQLWLLDQLGAW